RRTERAKKRWRRVSLTIVLNIITRARRGKADRVGLFTSARWDATLYRIGPITSILGIGPLFPILLQICTITFQSSSPNNAEQTDRPVRASSRYRVLDRARAQQWSKSRPHGPGTID
ncbi:MAG TPA: hypothetical protein VEK37_05670, partial [Gemmatimonadaceae bacterium]|nr:hypothetical protein [Gemmatimonadaceae bacterium]